MKLIKDKFYVITGATDLNPNFVKSCGIKFPQTVVHNGRWLVVKSKLGAMEWSVDYFFIKEFKGKEPAKLTVQFIPRTRKGVKYFQIKMSKNGKVFNHQYNSKQGAKKSFESLVNDLKNSNFIVK